MKALIRFSIHKKYFGLSGTIPNYLRQSSNCDFLKKGPSSGVRLFSSATDSAPVSESSSFAGDIGLKKKKINLEERLSSIVSSYDEIGTFQHRQSPYQEEEADGPHDLTMAKMLAAGLHLGSSTSLFNPFSQPFIFGERAGIHIFNLEITLAYLRRACNFTREVAASGGLIVFLSSKLEFSAPTIDAAIRSNGFYIYDRWIPGTITNRGQVLRPVRVPSGKAGETKPKYFKPDLLIIANYADNKTAVAEATKSNVPTIALIDSDQDPTGVTYPIPGNDDSVRGIELVMGLLSTAALEGLQKRHYLDSLKTRNNPLMSGAKADKIK